MNPITPPTLGTFDAPTETGEPTTDAAGRPDSTDASSPGVSPELPNEKPESQDPTELPDRG
jgi:hypothetical protein